MSMTPGRCYPVDRCSPEDRFPDGEWRSGMTKLRETKFHYFCIYPYIQNSQSVNHDHKQINSSLKFDFKNLCILVSIHKFRET